MNGTWRTWRPDRIRPKLSARMRPWRRAMRREGFSYLKTLPWHATHRRGRVCVLLQWRLPRIQFPVNPCQIGREEAVRIVIIVRLDRVKRVLIAVQDWPGLLPYRMKRNTANVQPGECLGVALAQPIHVNRFERQLGGARHPASHLGQFRICMTEPDGGGRESQRVHVH